MFLSANQANASGRLLGRLRRQRSPFVPWPKLRAHFRSRSARAYFAADTIFIDWVIFWMFFTDFRRRRTVQVLGHFTLD